MGINTVQLYTFCFMISWPDDTVGFLIRVGTYRQGDNCMFISSNTDRPTSYRHKMAPLKPSIPLCFN